MIVLHHSTRVMIVRRIVLSFFVLELFVVFVVVIVVFLKIGLVRGRSIGRVVLVILAFGSRRSFDPLIHDHFRLPEDEAVRRAQSRARATHRVAVPFLESHISQRNARQGFLYVHNEQSHVPSLTMTRARFALPMEMKIDQRAPAKTIASVYVLPIGHDSTGVTSHPSRRTDKQDILFLSTKRREDDTDLFLLRFFLVEFLSQPLVVLERRLPIGCILPVAFDTLGDSTEKLFDIRKGALDCVAHARLHVGETRVTRLIAIGSFACLFTHAQVHHLKFRRGEFQRMKRAFHMFA